MMYACAIGNDVFAKFTKETYEWWMYAWAINDMMDAGNYKGFGYVFYEKEAHLQPLMDNTYLQTNGNDYIDLHI